MTVHANKWRLSLTGVLAALLAFSTHASEVHVKGGTLRVEGSLTAANVIVESGATLTGGGSVTGDGDIKGTIAPGDGTSTNVDTLTFNGSMTFATGSKYECYAATHTSLDKLTVSSAVGGTCAVHMAKAVGAIPLDQVIIDGGSSGEYGGFSVGGGSPSDWRLTEGRTEDLLATEKTGDTDSDGIEDYWENDYFGDRTGCDPAVDHDVDGLTSGLEYTLNSDPTGRAAPDWWGDGPVLASGPPITTNDYAVCNQGQLKWIATNADLEMEAEFSGGAGSAVETTVNTFTPDNNFQAVNMGQVKNVAKPFYDRLQEKSKADTYPWTTNTTSDDVDYGAANIGQVKHIFSFDISE